jgi:glycosyltransferase involved in cell wall biosynthesis
VAGSNEQEGAPPRDVVYVIASMIVGGTQTHLLQVFRFLDRRRWRPRLFCLRDGGLLASAARDLDVGVTSFGMHGSLKHPSDLSGVVRMAARLRSVRPDVVHGYLLRGNFYGALAARLARVPAVITSKRGLHQPASGAERLAVRVSNALSDVVTGNSPAVLDFTREVEPPFRAPMEMIPSGIDVDRFERRGARDLRADLGLADRPVLGTAITWRPRKGYRLLFEAFAAVRKASPRAALLVAGVDRLEGDPADLADQLGIREAVYTLGRRDDMTEVLATFDVFALPSESEGMSNALLEAMAMRLPVVATAVGGNVVVIEDNVSGFLVEYPDSPALARKVLELFSNAELRKGVGGRARDRVVERYSAAAMVRDMEALYDRVLVEKGRSGRPSTRS